MLGSGWAEAGADEIFVDRDPALFAYVLDFLRSGTLARLPLWSTEPGLWRALRAEAQFLQASALLAELHCTHRCDFLRSGDRQGVLYWLGCGKDARVGAAYQNPSESGAVVVDTDECHFNVRSAAEDGPADGRPRTNSRVVHDFVQHNPPLPVTAHTCARQMRRRGTAWTS